MYKTCRSTTESSTATEISRRRTVPYRTRLKQTEDKNARGLKFAAQGLTAVEIKVARKPTKLKQEDHMDDRGSGSGPFVENPVTTALVVEGSVGSAVAHSFIDDSAFCSGSAESGEDEPGKVLNDNFSLHCLVGSEGHARHSAPPPPPPPPPPKWRPSIYYGSMCTYIYIYIYYTHIYIYISQDLG